LPMTRTAVAPHAGAWIERFHRHPHLFEDVAVAPHAGAWIESC